MSARRRCVVASGGILPETNGSRNSSHGLDEARGQERWPHDPGERSASGVFAQKCRYGRVTEPDRTVSDYRHLTVPRAFTATLPMRKHSRYLLPLACIVTLLPSLQADIVDGQPSPAIVDRAAAKCGSQSIHAARTAPVGSRRGGIKPYGDLHPRQPYATFRTYYYDRPYGPGQAAMRGGPAVRVDPSLGVDQSPGVDHSIQLGPVGSRWYSTRPFDQIDAEFAAKVAANPSVRPYLVEPTQDRAGVANPDGYLEYADWRRHRDARTRWLKDRQAAEVIPLGPADEGNPKTLRP